MRNTILLEEKKSGFLSGITSKIKTIISGPESKEESSTTIAQPESIKTTKAEAAKTETAKAESPSKQQFDPKIQKEINNMAQQTGLSQEEVAQAELATKQGQMDMNTFRVHLKQLATAGGFHTALKFVPGMGQFKEAIDKARAPGGVADPAEIQKMVAIIEAMTEEERKNPQVFNNHGFKAKQRLAKATGQDVNNVNRLLQAFEQYKFLQSKMLEFQKLGKVPTTMQEMMQMMTQGGMMSKKDLKGFGKVGK
eukprot:CAMPEP_0168573352 /NCGR_PEP_ID=MMETSP0413-20121227/18481_1 /TAXON_ID=136452 /ORGANISM="Filamoeba nolandi, Strain NC-AS-23-1" /LENGTH=251 /DNA_ID=CAMNT_0008606581 /DNA_START=105 /DNA_END=860 /DNA_ORIENTATION=+